MIVRYACLYDRSMFLKLTVSIHPYEINKEHWNFAISSAHIYLGMDHIEKHMAHMNCQVLLVRYIFVSMILEHAMLIKSSGLRISMNQSRYSS